MNSSYMYCVDRKVNKPTQLKQSRARRIRLGAETSLHPRRALAFLFFSFFFFSTSASAQLNSVFVVSSRCAVCLRWSSPLPAPTPHHTSPTSTASLHPHSAPIAGVLPRSHPIPILVLTQHHSVTLSPCPRTTSPQQGHWLSQTRPQSLSPIPPAVMVRQKRPGADAIRLPAGPGPGPATKPSAFEIAQSTAPKRYITWPKNGGKR